MYTNDVNKLRVAAGTTRVFTGVIAGNHPVCLSRPYRPLSTLFRAHTSGTKGGTLGARDERRTGSFMPVRRAAEEELSRSLRYLRGVYVRVHRA